MKGNELPDTTRKFISKLKKITNGHIYVYSWNQESVSSPLCIFMEPTAVEKVGKTLEELGAPMKTLENSGSKFDLSTMRK